MPQKSRNALDGDIITIHRGLAIYKVKASPFWHARIRDHRSKKYVVRSTKETSRVKARQAAKELEFEILGGEKRVEREYTFRFYASRLLSRSEVMVERKERNANYVRTMKQFLNNEEWGLLKAFGTKDVRELRTREFQQYMDDLNRKRPDLSTSTRNTLTATFRNVLKVARDDGTIDALPATPRGRQVDNPRAYFPFYPLVARREDDVYKAILRAAKALADEGAIIRNTPVTSELYDLIVFTTHSFVRPIVTELYAIKHRDIVQASEPRRLLVTIQDGKTGYRVANTMPGAVDAYERIKQRYPEAKPKDYLFLPGYTNRETASKIIQRQFRAVMERAGVKDDPEAKLKYSLYSLRHTAICMRIVKSGGQVNIFNLAKNAGTSVEQIERFYARKLPLSAEMARNLQMFEAGDTNGAVPGRTKEEAEALRPEDYVLLPCPGDDDDYADDAGEANDAPFPYPESTRLPAATPEDVQALLKKMGLKG